MTETTRQARVRWKSLTTRATGHGEWADVESVRAWVESLNAENRTIPSDRGKLTHLVEYHEGET